MKPFDEFPFMVGLRALKRERQLAGKRVLLVVASDSGVRVNTVWLRSQLAARAGELVVRTLDEKTGTVERASIEEEAAGAAMTVVSLFDDVAAWRGRAGPSPALVDSLRRVCGAAGRAVILVFAGPPTAGMIDWGTPGLCCYDGSRPCQKAAVEALFGCFLPTGVFPGVP